MIRTAGHGAQGLAYWREVRIPSRAESANDQREYRAALLLNRDAPLSRPPSPPYVPPSYPNCTRWCRNGFHPSECPEAQR